MKGIRKSHYKLSDEDFAKLWAQGVFVLDTNVLLMPYKVTRNDRETLLKLFEAYKEKFWIPFQVCLEFQDTRPDFRRDLIGYATGAITNLNNMKQSFRSIASREKIENSAEVRSINAIITEIVKIRSEFLVDFGDKPNDDPIFDRLNQIFEGRFGPPPANKTEHEALLKDAENRYQGEIPPGYKDRKKDGDLSHGGYLYPKKFGDLILWRQIIEKCRIEGVQAVALVTDDKKDDWFWNEEGKTVGPRPELREEMAEEGGLERFWIYPFETFMRQANGHWGRKIPSEDIERLIEAINASAKAEDGSDYRDWHAARSLPERILRPMLNWLSGRYGEVVPLPHGRFPFLHFRVAENTGVVVIPWTGGVDSKGQLDGTLSRASYALYKSEAANLILVFCCETQQAVRSAPEQIEVYLEEHADRLRSVRERAEIVVGYLADGKDFIQVA